MVEVWIRNEDSVDMPGFACAMIQRNQTPVIDGNRTVFKAWRPRIESPFSVEANETAAVPAATLRSAFVINGPQPIRKGEVGVAFTGLHLRALVKPSPVPTDDIIGPIHMQWYLDTGSWGFENHGRDPHRVLGVSAPTRYVSPITTHPNAFACTFLLGSEIEPGLDGDCNVMRMEDGSWETKPWRVKVWNTSKNRAVQGAVPLQAKLEYGSLRYIVDVEECET